MGVWGWRGTGTAPPTCQRRSPQRAEPGRQGPGVGVLPRCLALSSGVEFLESLMCISSETIDMHLELGDTGAAERRELSSGEGRTGPQLSLPVGHDLATSKWGPLKRLDGLGPQLSNKPITKSRLFSLALALLCVHVSVHSLSKNPTDVFFSCSSRHDIFPRGGLVICYTWEKTHPVFRLAHVGGFTLRLRLRGSTGHTCGHPGPGRRSGSSGRGCGSQAGQQEVNRASLLESRVHPVQPVPRKSQQPAGRGGTVLGPIAHGVHPEARTG